MDDLLRAVRSVAAGGTYVDPVLAGTLAQASRRARSAPSSPAASATSCGCSRTASRTRRSATKLFISAETVRTHIRKAMDKLGADTRTQAVARALRDQLIA